MSLTERRGWIDRFDPQLSLAGQCRLLGLSRWGVYYQPALENAENQTLMRLLDQEYTRPPFFGVRRMAWFLGEQGFAVNVKRVRRLLRLLGLEALYSNLVAAFLAVKVHRGIARIVVLGVPRLLVIGAVPAREAFQAGPGFDERAGGGEMLVAGPPFLTREIVDFGAEQWGHLGRRARAESSWPRCCGQRRPGRTCSSDASVKRSVQ